VHPDHHDRRDGSAINLYTRIDGFDYDLADVKRADHEFLGVIQSGNSIILNFRTRPPAGNPASGARRDADRPDGAAAEPERAGNCAHGPNDAGYQYDCCD
jgi:hypothetical protein